MNRDKTDAAPPDKARLEPLDQALVRAGAALRSQAVPAELQHRVALGWAQVVCGERLPTPTAASAEGHRAPRGWRWGGGHKDAGTGAVAGLGLPGMAWPRWQRWLAGSGATLCAMALLVSLLLMLTAPPLAEPLAAAGTGLAGEAGPRGRSTGFIPVVSAQRLGELTGPESGPAWLVPGEWPRERLAALGLPFDPERAGETVRAELLVHASGDVLAVRVLAQ